MKFSCRIALCTVFCLALSACENDYTPEGIVQTAGRAIQNGNLSDLQASLTGDAMNQYGNEAGLSALQAQVSGLDLSEGTPSLVSEYWPADDVMIDKYEVVVLSQKSGSQDQPFKLWIATVICRTGNQDRPVVLTYTPMNVPRFPHHGPITVCKVSELIPA
jgi:hypothetical protein